MANTFYAHNSNAGGVLYKIDGTTLAVTDLPALSGASDFGLAVSPDGSTLIAAHVASNTIATLDLANPTAWVDTATDMSAFTTPELLYQPSGRIIIVDRYTGIWYIPAGTWPDSPTLLTNVVPGASNVLQAVLSPDGTKVYCAYTNQYG